MTLARVVAASALVAALLATTACQQTPTNPDPGTDDPVLTPPTRHPGLYTVFKNNSNSVTTENPIGFVVISSAEPGVEYWIMTDTEEGPPVLTTSNDWMHVQLVTNDELDPAEVCRDSAYGGSLLNPHMWRIQIMVEGDATPCSGE